MGALFGLVVLWCVVNAQSRAERSGFDWVDPLIGTTNGGLSHDKLKLKDGGTDQV
jgi:hypothetical protein